MNHATLLYDYFDESAKKYPGKEALIFSDRRYTYREIFNRVNFLSRFFINHGLEKQDRVLIYMDNSPEIIISFYAAMKAGGIFTIINSVVQLQKLSYIIGDCKPKIIVADERKQNIVLKAVRKNAISCTIIWTGPNKINPSAEENVSTFHWTKIFGRKSYKLNHYDLQKISNRRVLDIDLAGLIYTSGSTGEPKGVMESHYNIISAARSIIQYLGNTPDDIILNTLPLSFDYGLYQVIMAFMFGGTIVLERSFIFLTKVLNLVAKEKVTGFPIVPTIVAMIFKTIDLKSFDLSTLRYISNTGAAFPAEHIKRFRKLMPHVQIYSMFGLTECKRIAYLPPEEIDNRTDSVGKAMPNCEVFVVDENEEPVKPGQTGELVVRGSNVMQGYWNAPELTAKTFRPGLGFREKLLFTGDYFKTDQEGYLYFIGRKDDMIKSRGERISAKEVENIINQVEGINECAVVGVDDEILGQAIKAFVVPVKGFKPDSQKIIFHCAKNLEPFSVPRYIEFLDELPKTAHGKTDKKRLKSIPVNKEQE